MTGPQVPPGGFRWVHSPGAPGQPEDPGQPGYSGQPGYPGQPGSPNQPYPPQWGAPPPGWSPPQAPAPRKRRRWPWLLALILVVAVVAGGVLTWRSTNDTPRLVEMADAPIGTPADRLIGFPLDRRPVPTWRLTAADLGISPELGVRVLQLFATDGDNAYFSAANTTSDLVPPPGGWVGWVFGVNVKTGTVLFPRIEMPGFNDINGRCFGNGPGVGVCLTDANPEYGYTQHAWVLDLDHGALTHTGPTDLSPSNLAPNTYEVARVGNYEGEARLVATRRGEGIWGIGPNAERTWFVPGEGSLFRPGFLDTEDIPPLTIANQQGPGALQSDAVPYRVFSVLDGKDLTPTPPEGTTIRRAAVYNGGFVYVFSQERAKDGLLFYNTDGELVGRQQYDDGLLNTAINSAMPTAAFLGNPSAWHIYSAAGDLVISLPFEYAGARFKTIGTNVYVDQSADTGQPAWQQWNLLTGGSGPKCDNISLGTDYTGSDGRIVISELDSMTASRYTAVDPATCTPMWEIPADEVRAGELQLWKAGTSLIQRTQTELSGLGPPA